MKTSLEDGINRTLGRLEGKVDEGFKSIHHRLDKMNGSIENHAIKINDLETFRDEHKGQEKQTTKIAGIAGTFAGAFISAVIWIATRLFKNN